MWSSEEDIFDEDPDLGDWEFASDVPSGNQESVPETDLLYVDLDTDKIVAPSDLAGRTYCTYTDKMVGFEQISAEVMAWVNNAPWLAFDIETFKRDHSPLKTKDPPGWETDLVGAFSISYGGTTYVFKIDPLIRPEYTNEENLRELLELVLSKPLVGHNLKFDLRFMWRYYQKAPPLCFDTFLAAKVVHCERNIRYDLKSVVARFLKKTISKEQQRSAWGSLMFLVPQIAYSAKDTLLVAELVEPMVAAMDKDREYWSKNTNSDFVKVWNLHNKVAHLEFYLLPRLMRMEANGFYMDTQEIELQFNRLKKLEGGLKQVWLSAVNNRGHRPINPNSSVQVKRFLTGTLGREGLVRPNGEKILLGDIPNIDQDVLQEFVGIGIEPVDALFDYKSTTGNIKRIEEFHKMTIPKVNRLYTSFKQWGAVSGRTSCPKPNLQNIKNAEKHGVNLRSLFIAPPGKKLVVVDYSQIQLVIIAEISQDPVMREIINSGGDLHTATAIAVSGHDNITKTERKQAKAVNFGYCMDFDTPILTKQGYKPIQNVQPGTHVLTHRGNWRPVKKTFSREVQLVYRISVGGGQDVVCTPEHQWRICSSSGDYWKATLDLEIGDLIQRHTGKPARVESISDLIGPRDVYDLEVADDHSFIANGLVSHNCFGMGALKFQDYARVSYKLYYDLEECQDIRAKYFDLYKGVAKWHKQVGFGKRNGMFPIETLYGRRIIADAFTKATNFPVQGTEKDIVALAISFITDRFERDKLPGMLVNCIHDELVAEVPDAYAEDVKAAMEQEMIRAAHMILKTVKVRADGHIVDKWSEAK